MKLLETIINTLFPSRCIHCAKQTKYPICAACLSRLSLNRALFCGQCRARLPYSKKICHPGTPYILGAAAEYADPIVQDLIHSLKFHFLPASGKVLGELIVGYVESIPEIKNLLVVRKEDIAVLPIPLSSKRLRKRGFNQSEIIARVLAERYNLDLLTDCLIRIKDSRPQSETQSAQERLQNVQDCFKVRGGKLQNKKIIVLVDDVITSGATVREAAAKLKPAGVEKIYALVSAKA